MNEWDEVDEQGARNTKWSKRKGVGKDDGGRWFKRAQRVSGLWHVSESRGVWYGLESG